MAEFFWVVKASWVAETFSVAETFWVSESFWVCNGCNDRAEFTIILSYAMYKKGILGQKTRSIFKIPKVRDLLVGRLKCYIRYIEKRRHRSTICTCQVHSRKNE